MSQPLNPTLTHDKRLQRVPLSAKLFLKCMLDRQDETRLGADLDYTKIVKHPWFASVNWKGISERTHLAPWIPQPPHAAETRSASFEALGL